MPSTHSNAVDLETRSTPKATLAVYFDDPEGVAGIENFAYRRPPQPVACVRLTLPRELARLIRRAAKRASVAVETYVRQVLATHFRRPDLAEFPKAWTPKPGRRPA